MHIMITTSPSPSSQFSLLFGRYLWVALPSDDSVPPPACAVWAPLDEGDWVSAAGRHRVHCGLAATDTPDAPLCPDWATRVVPYAHAELGVPRQDADHLERLPSLTEGWIIVGEWTPRWLSDLTLSERTPDDIARAVSAHAHRATAAAAAAEAEAERASAPQNQDRYDTAD